ncbi:MAG: hypothetical protein Q27BB25_00120 [Blastomonas sp. CACIA14H2]|nr:MAG: hypothetical protein Q27BB25_00120 [Blastomonas sp. CACIA14H2]
MATQMHLLKFQRVDHTQQVAHQGFDTIVLHSTRPAAAPVPTLIGRKLTDTAAKALCQRPPTGCMVGKAMKHQERRAFSLLQIVEFYTVRCDAVLGG